MADIDDPTAIAFCNEKVRPAANHLACVWTELTGVLAQWFALGGTEFIPNTSDEVEDGAVMDGRPVITGADVVNLITRLSELQADWQAGGNAKLNTILAVANRLQWSQP